MAARVAALLNHPNIVQAFDFGKVGSDCFLTMEWIDGASLGELLVSAVRNKRSIPVPVAAYVGKAMAEALS